MFYGIPFIIDILYFQDNCFDKLFRVAVHSRAKCINTVRYCILIACVEVFYTGSVFIL
jgi:hypothetical protein